MQPAKSTYARVSPNIRRQSMAESSLPTSLSCSANASAATASRTARSRSGLGRRRGRLPPGTHRRDKEAPGRGFQTPLAAAYQEG